MRKNFFRVSVLAVCLSVVMLCLRLQSCSNIVGAAIPPGYGRLTIAGSQRAITEAEVSSMTLRYKFNGIDVTQGYMDFAVGTSVTIEVDGYVGGAHRLHHEEPPIVVHSGENVVRIVLSKSRDEVPFNIYWELFGGKIPDDKMRTKYFVNDKYVLPEAEKDGYEFLGWYTDSGFERQITSLEMDTMGDLTLYAKWTQIYNIAWRLDGGSGSDGKTTYTELDAEYPLPTPTKDGFEFLGWYTDESFAENAKVASLPQGSSGDITFYAKWNKTYNIAWVLDGGSVSGNRETYTALDAEYALPTPTKSGYNFDGWYTDGSFAENAKVASLPQGSSGDKTFYAKWKKPVLGQYGDSIETSHFEHIKDVQWGGSSTTSFTVSSPKYCYNAKTGKQTASSLWTEGSYVHLTKNDHTTNGGAREVVLNTAGKTIPTFTETLYTKTGSGYTETVLADDVIILGISKFGMMTVAKDTSGSYHYGAFIYTSEGWKESGNGTQALSGEWHVYPTEEEIKKAIAEF